MRGISDKFIEDLKTGTLVEVLNTVKVDHTLCLEIRENYINIYYRGGNALKITEKSEGIYEFWFDVKYVADDTVKQRIDSLLSGSVSTNNMSIAKKWIEQLPYIKNQMDIWFGQHPKEEREYQQLVTCENNYGSGANSTDYYICDIEYANEDRRFDMIAVKWPSTTSDRKNNRNLRLSFIEMKYLDGAITGDAGLKKHIMDFNKFLSDTNNLKNIKDEMVNIFNTKVELGLLNEIKKIASFSDENPEYILILANHDPAKSALFRELRDVIKSNDYVDFCSKAELKIATACFMGYGLYNECIYSLDKFLIKYEDIFKKMEL